MIEVSDEDYRKSKRVLFVHLGFCAFAPAAAWLYFLLGLKFSPCMFNRITGMYCLTCGSTRAVYELLHFHILRSLLLNPVPIMLGLFMLSVVGFETAGVIKRCRYPFRWALPCIVAIVTVAAIYCVLRNIGIVPVPEAIFP
ncbi:MAG: DUF2752 domain-containing protein [Oscillospiraceae bacterium]